MSLFHKLRASKKSSEPRKAGQAQTKAESQPYRHIPTHAARDALSQAPPGATAEADKRAIREQRRLRGEMTRQKSDLSMVNTANTSSGSVSDGRTNHGTREHETKLLPVFQDLIFPPAPKPTDGSTREASPAFGLDNSSSTASSSSQASSLLEIPSRNPRRPKRPPLPNPHPSIPHILEVHAIVKNIDAQLFENQTPQALEKHKTQPLHTHQLRERETRRDKHCPIPKPHPPIPQIPEHHISAKIDISPPPQGQNPTQTQQYLEHVIVHRPDPERSVIHFSRPRPRVPIHNRLAEQLAGDPRCPTAARNPHEETRSPVLAQPARHPAATTSAEMAEPVVRSMHPRMRAQGLHPGSTVLVDARTVRLSSPGVEQWRWPRGFQRAATFEDNAQVASVDAGNGYVDT